MMTIAERLAQAKEQRALWQQKLAEAQEQVIRWDAHVQVLLELETEEEGG